MMTNNNTPEFTMPPPPPWWENDHEIWIEPIAPDYSIVAVHAQRFINGPIGTALLYAPEPARFADIVEGWAADWLALSRAIALAIRSCDAQRAELRKAA